VAEKIRNVEEYFITHYNSFCRIFWYITVSKSKPQSVQILERNILHPHVTEFQLPDAAHFYLKLCHVLSGWLVCLTTVCEWTKGSFVPVHRSVCRAWPIRTVVSTHSMLHYECMLYIDLSSIYRFRWFSRLHWLARVTWQSARVRVSRFTTLWWLILRQWI